MSKTTVLLLLAVLIATVIAINAPQALSTYNQQLLNTALDHVVILAHDLKVLQQQPQQGPQSSQQQEIQEINKEINQQMNFIHNLTGKPLWLLQLDLQALLDGKIRGQNVLDYENEDDYEQSYD